MAVDIDCSGGWRLVADQSEPEVVVAVEELAAALGPPGEAGVEIALSHAGGGKEGFRRQASANRIELRGESARGLLFASYALLEEMGAGWPWPGEQTPAARKGSLARAEVESTPALSGRCLVLGERALVEDAESWIVWAARNRLNSLFVHVSTAPRPLGAAPEEPWRERRDAAVAAARRRGMTIEHGGHLLPELLPGGELQALAEGRPLGAEARRILEDHIRAHPEADVLHLWGADVAIGARGGRRASEAALRSANALARIAEEVRPGTVVAYLAYHATEEVPSGVRPRDNVCLVFAPRERCYEHGLADPTCTENVRHRALLEAQIEHFGSAAPPRAFEYWFDAILFPGGVPDLSETMAEDLAFYRQAGVHTVQMLMTGHGGTPRPHPNPPAFARLAWDPSA